MMSKVIKDTHASGKESMDMILSECLNAVNEMTRYGGFAPVQWVLSRLPRNPATMGDEGECLDVVLCKHTTNNLRGTVTLSSRSTRSSCTMGLK